MNGQENTKRDYPQMYPTQEQLLRLIEQAEKQQITAPVYLKDEIMCRAVGHMDVKLSKEIKLSKDVKLSKEMRLFLYGAKIAAAAVAAIFMLLFIPASHAPEPQVTASGQRTEMPYRSSMFGGDVRRKSDAVTVALDDVTTRLCKKLNRITSWMIMEDKKYD